MFSQDCYLIDIRLKANLITEWAPVPMPDATLDWRTYVDRCTLQSVWNSRSSNFYLILIWDIESHSNAGIWLVTYSSWSCILTFLLKSPVVCVSYPWMWRLFSVAARLCACLSTQNLLEQSYGLILVSIHSLESPGRHDQAIYCYSD